MLSRVMSRTRHAHKGTSSNYLTAHLCIFNSKQPPLLVDPAVGIVIVCVHNQVCHCDIIKQDTRADEPQPRGMERMVIVVDLCAGSQMGWRRRSTIQKVTCVAGFGLLCVYHVSACAPLAAVVHTGARAPGPAPSLGLGARRQPINPGASAVPAAGAPAHARMRARYTGARGHGLGARIAVRMPDAAVLTGLLRNLLAFAVYPPFLDRDLLRLSSKFHKKSIKMPAKPACFFTQ